MSLLYPVSSMSNILALNIELLAPTFYSNRCKRKCMHPSPQFEMFFQLLLLLAAAAVLLFSIGKQCITINPHIISSSLAVVDANFLLDRCHNSLISQCLDWVVSAFFHHYFCICLAPLSHLLKIEPEKQTLMDNQHFQTWL